MKISACMVALVLGFAGCSGSNTADETLADAGSPSTCAVGLSFSPASPIAGPSTRVRVTPHFTSAEGVLSYRWHVRFGGTEITATPAVVDGSEIEFVAAQAGIYDVRLAVTSSATPCPEATLPINVRAPGAQSARVRLRVIPPLGLAAPPLEKTLVIDGGATADIGAIQVDRGVAVRGTVRGMIAGVPAYLRLSPNGSPDAIVEAFSDASGSFDARLLDQPHTVLVVPAVAGFAPRRFSSWSPSSGAPLELDAGSPVTGTVRDPAGAPVAGASVQLSIDGVPSTLATTADDGSFALRAVAQGGEVSVEVTPPGASGLPRLTAISAALDLGVPLQIRYAASLVRKSLAGTRVLRQGAPVAGAKLLVVGTLAAAGTVTAGAEAVATGEVRIAGSADATGTLPDMRVPAANLEAVITVGTGDLAVAALDATGPVPETLEAPAMPMIATRALAAASDASLGGAVLDVVPVGALAMAGSPVLHLRADTAGAFHAALAAGGHYDLRFHDPAGRAGLLVVADRVAETIAAAYPLTVALQLRGRLTAGTGALVLAGASIQILCDRCSGLDRAKPIAEGASDEVGAFTLAVPDPGTM